VDLPGLWNEFFISRQRQDGDLVRREVLVELQHHPELGRPGRVPKTRELVVPNLPYILPYYIKKKEVRILAVMHTARKWPDDFSTT